MNGIGAVFARELGSYFRSPVAFVFVLLFVFLTGAFAFEMGGFFARGQADLVSFFAFHPYLHLFLMPALAMRLWSEERKTGTIELLLTLPLAPWAAMLGKFLAAWAFAGVALAFTTPMWITVAWLGNPDHGVIALSYLGSLLLAGGFLAVGACISAATSNQVIAFIVSAVLCFLLLASGLPVVTSFIAATGLPVLLQIATSLSALTHYDTMMKGVLDAAGLVYFATLIGCWLIAGAITVEWARGR